MQKLQCHLIPTLCLMVLLLCMRGFVYGQTDTTSWAQKPSITYSGYIDIFYAYDFNQPQTDYRQSFLYNHNRHNELTMNNGYLKINAKQQKYRANLAIHAGTYVSDNYATEPTSLQYIFESNIGLSLTKKNNLWIDAGIFASHIGFESAISKDNWTLTRSLLAENSPYYLSGVKLTYTPNERWELSSLACNGWQRIKKVSGNSLPAFGTQIKYIHLDKLTINWSTFIGTDDPDTTRRMRYFNNFYLQSQFTKRFGVIAGFDIGAEQKFKNSAEYYWWYSPVLIFRYTLSEKWSATMRAEYFYDENGVIISTGTPEGFRTEGLSLNIDYSPAKSILCRIEGRHLKSHDALFVRRNKMIHENFALVSSIAIAF